MSFVVRLLCIPCLILLCLPSRAQEATDPVAELSYGRIFHVVVHGTPLSIDGQPNLQDAKVDVTGKAFAIGPDLLIAAGSVVGDADDWKQISPRGPEFEQLDRVIKPVRRSISVSQVQTFAPFEMSPPESRVVVTQPELGIDAVGLIVPGMQIAQPFRLSLCGIVQDAPYRAILTKNSGLNPDSIRRPIAIDVVARGYDPDQYGNLYLFEPQQGGDMPDEISGLAGSPILDKDDDVVAMVSVVTPQDGGKILATPISAQFPGAPGLMASIPRGSEGSAVQCSLSQTVRRIYDRVATQLNWNVSAIYSKEDGKLEDVVISYDDSSKDPTVREIKLKFWFYGVVDPQTMRVERAEAGSREERGLILKMDPGELRTFRTDKIGAVGRELLETRLADECARNSACAIHRVTIQIIPKIDPAVWPELRQDLGEPTSIIRNLEWIGERK